jgi:hypothetical protein
MRETRCDAGEFLSQGIWPAGGADITWRAAFESAHPGFVSSALTRGPLARSLADRARSGSVTHCTITPDSRTLITPLESQADSIIASFGQWETARG